MLSYVFFDLDGTLMDFDQCEAAAFAGAFAGEGYYTETEMLIKYREISAELWASLEKGQVTIEHLQVERFRRLFDHYGWELDPAQFNDIYVHTLGLTGILTDHALEVLSALKGKIPMAVVTNGVAKAQRARMASAGITHFFDHVFISEELGAQKPAPLFFDKALSACGIDDPKRVLIVGDSLSADMKGGIDSGLTTCWYNPKKEHNTKNFPVDYEITHLNAVISVVEGH